MDARGYMQFALKLASVTSGQTSPNPVVGAVVVQGDEIIGFGAHLKAGEEHAEVHALQMAGERAVGATIYVTLEPCSHYGKTGPCADLLIKKGISHAVVACLDPNEQVAGQGIERLRQAGVKVDVGILRQEAEHLNKEFFHYMRTKTPYVTIKSAVSLDGKTATRTGDSKWITGEDARLDVHHYRHQHEAILVGVNTVLADNPNLTTRLPNGGKNPLRIILDTTLRTPIDANVVSDQKAETWIFVGKKVVKQQLEPFIKKDLVKIIQLDDVQINIINMLKVLGENGIMSLFVEGGSEINGSFLESRQINQLVTYIAPKLIGGKVAPTSIAGMGFASIEEVPLLKIQTIEQIGDDVKIVSEVLKEDEDVYRDY